MNGLSHALKKKFRQGNSLRYSHCGDVLSWKGIGGVADEQAGLTHSSGGVKKRKKYF